MVVVVIKKKTLALFNLIYAHDFTHVKCTLNRTYKNDF